MFVPALDGSSSTEIGHRNYQHPARDNTKFGAWLDNFSAWLIYLSVHMLIRDPSLWHRFGGGDECILFRSVDLQKPLESRLFYALQSHPNEEIRKDSWLLRYLLSLGVEEVPALGTPIPFEIKINWVNRRKTPFGLLEATEPASDKEANKNKELENSQSSSVKKTSKTNIKPMIQSVAGAFIFAYLFGSVLFHSGDNHDSTKVPVKAAEQKQASNLK